MRRTSTLFPLPIVLVTAVTLGGCATNIGDALPASMGGLPIDAPAREATPPAYPAVHDMPPPRAAPVLDEEGQKKLEKELIEARKRQQGRQPKQ